MTTYQRERDVAIAALWEAGRLCRHVQRQITPAVLEKRDKSPVTIADFGSQALLCRAIANAFPHDPIIAEEDAAALRHEHPQFVARIVAEIDHLGIEADAEQACTWIDRGNARAAAPRVWTLDPIDGTKGFLRGEQYAVSLALIIEGQVVLGGLCCPNLGPSRVASSPTGTVFLAVRGAGAWAIDEATGRETELAVSRETDPARLRFCESVEAAHSDHDESARLAKRLGITAPPVRLDSQAKYAVVARGEAELYLRLPTRPGYVEKIWDHAGGSLVMTEAGGKVTDITGRSLDFSLGAELSANRGVVASHGPLHETILETLGELEAG